MKETIKKLNKGLEDKEYKHGWISNIAMSYIDSERWYREKNNKIGKYLNNNDKHAIANNAAIHFLSLLEG